MALLAGRKIVVVAGKGGVGKTTTSAALALLLAKRGLKTLLVTVDPAKRLEDSLGIEIGFSERPVQPNLTAMMLDPATVIREHLEREIPQAQVTDHPLFKYVTNYMPGINELMAIGKLNDFRKEGKYDVIVVDTAPTGHALSFLSAPKAIRELMSEKSLIRWAIRGYAVWQKLSGTMKQAGNIFKKKEDRLAGPPDVDFERIFEDIRNEAERIQEFLTDPTQAAFIIVTLPEKLPVEETLDLHKAATEELQMEVSAFVINKVQPDVFGTDKPKFSELRGDAKAIQALEKAIDKAGYPKDLVQQILTGAQFGQVRRNMNLGHINRLAEALPAIAVVQVPLFDTDIHGFTKLREYMAHLEEF